MLSWIDRAWFRKLFFAFAIIVIPAILTAGFLLSRALRDQWISRLDKVLVDQARLISATLPPEDFFSQKPSPSLQNFVENKSAICGCRITLINLDGVVLADSSVEFEEMGLVENHKTRPEFEKALSGSAGAHARRSATIGKNLNYAAIPFENKGKIIGSVRVAIPVENIEADLAPLGREIVFVFLLSLILAILLALVVSRSMSQPVKSLAEAAGRISVGDYSARVETLVPNELGTLGTALNALAEGIQEKIVEINREKAQLQAILTNMNEGVVAVGEKGLIIAANPAFSEIVDKTPGDILGKSFLEILRDNQLEKMIHDALQLKKPRAEEISILNPTPKTFEAISAPLILNKEPKGALLVLHDITRLRQLEKVRKDFVANVSHELRTPLAAIKGYAETLREGEMKDPKTSVQFLKIIEKHVDNMTSLVDDLLNLSALESDRQERLIEKFPMRELAEEALESLRALAKKRNVSLSSAFQSEEPVQGDKNQMRRVWTNLIENAIKFNRDGGSVQVGAQLKSGQKEFFVKDSGIGIPPAAANRIFERFFRVDKARSREYGGTGLGLSIVKHAIESQGGTLRLESEEGMGSTFFFTVNPA